MPYEIPNEKLLLERMPKPEQEIMELTKFALTFDGYKYWGQDCGEIAGLVGTYYDEHGYLPDGMNLSDLRACLFYDQRCLKNADQMIGFVNDEGEVFVPKPNTKGIEEFMRYLVSRIARVLYEKKQNQQKINSLNNFLKIGIINSKQFKKTINPFVDFE